MLILIILRISLKHLSTQFEPKVENYTFRHFSTLFSNRLDIGFKTLFYLLRRKKHLSILQFIDYTLKIHN